jgi:hypothetical protein
LVATYPRISNGAVVTVFRDENMQLMISIKSGNSEFIYFRNCSLKGVVNYFTFATNVFVFVPFDLSYKFKIVPLCARTLNLNYEFSFNNQHVKSILPCNLSSLFLNEIIINVFDFITVDFNVDYINDKFELKHAATFRRVCDMRKKQPLYI